MGEDEFQVPQGLVTASLVLCERPLVPEPMLCVRDAEA